MGIFSKKTKNKIPQKSWQGRRTGAYASVPKKEKKRETKFSRVLFWLLLLVFLGICGYILLFSSYLDVDAISVEGNQGISNREIEDRVMKSIEGKYFNFFPKKNFFFVNEKNINAALKSNFDQLEVASIEKKFPGKIFVQVTERKPELVWCSGGVCYFIDKSGLAYGGAVGTDEELRGRSFLTVVDDSAVPVDLGKTKIDPDYIGFIEAANAMLRDDLKLDPAESFHTSGMASREISVKNGEGWTVKLSSEFSVEDAKKIIQTLFEKELNGEVRKNLDYLDLRIENKIYYKIKQEEKNDSAE
ncbi:MAG: FtsQ-type POTRA domain-containing protein [Candidatus Moranbacteria bacterium]|nr:FtsQ-type POTRA domain-containing protein [Candidatus Moranbacteria bacterium]